MPTKKKAKRVQSAERRVQSKERNQNHSAFCALSSALPEARSPKPEASAAPEASYEEQRASLEEQLDAIQSQIAMLDERKLAEQKLAEQKLAEQVQRSERRAQREAQSAEQMQIALLQEQNALLREQIAALKEGARGEGLGARSEELGVRSEKSGIETNTPHSSLLTPHSPEARSPKPEASPSPSPLAPRPSPRETALLKPDLISVTATGSNTIKVEWWGVPNASGYDVQTALNMAFNADVRIFHFNASANMAILTGGFEPDIQYYVRIRATGQGEFTNSPWTNNMTVTTHANPNDGLTSWLANLQAVNQYFMTLLPDVENASLSPLQRRRLLGSGVRRYGYFDKISDTAAEYPQFWPLGMDESEKMKEMIREIEVLRNLLIYFEGGARLVTDRLLTLGDAVFRIANVYYRGVREAALQKIPEGEAAFQLLRLFWQRPRRTNGATTKKRAMRDARALQRGTRVGKVTFENEADQVIPGKKRISDETQPKPRRNAAGTKSFEENEYFDDESRL